MKLYLSTAGVWEAPGKQSKGAEKIDVPTDTAGLVDFLNTQSAIDKDYGPEPEFDEVDEPSPPPPPQKAGNPDYARDWSKTEISDFILNRASVSQVEDIFACLGTRFKELAKEQAGELIKGGGIGA